MAQTKNIGSGKITEDLSHGTVSDVVVQVASYSKRRSKVYIRLDMYSGRKFKPATHISSIVLKKKSILAVLCTFLKLGVPVYLPDCLWIL